MASFGQLAAELDATVPVEHAVNEALLADVVAAGTMTPVLQARIVAAVHALVEQGAGVVLCTCSTIGGAAEGAAVGDRASVMRVDRPMAEAAVDSGRRSLVAAARASTLTPTLALLGQVAERRGSPLNAQTLLCEGAWAHFERGDRTSYASTIARQIRSAAAPGDVVVLAQASMAPAAELLQGESLQVLSSPRLGVAAALQRFRASGV